MRSFGYICTKTGEPGAAGVESELVMLAERRGVVLDGVFCDHITAAKRMRPGWQDLLRALRPGDQVFLPRIEMVGENYDEVVRAWNVLRREKQADVVVVDFSALDTRGKHSVAEIFQSDVMLEVYAFVKMQERERRRILQANGIRQAKKRGVRFGRTRRQLPENFVEQAARFQAGKATLRECAQACGMPLSTFYNKVKRGRSD